MTTRKFEYIVRKIWTRESALPQMKSVNETYRQKGSQVITIAHAFGIHAFPEVVLLDSEGTVVASPQTFHGLQSMLKELK